MFPWNPLVESECCCGEAKVTFRIQIKNVDMFVQLRDPVITSPQGTILAIQDRVQSLGGTTMDFSAISGPVLVAVRTGTWIVKFLYDTFYQGKDFDADLSFDFDGSAWQTCL